MLLNFDAGVLEKPTYKMLLQFKHEFGFCFRETDNKKKENEGGTI